MVVCCRLSHDKSSGEVKLYIDKSVVSDSGSYMVHVGRQSMHVTSHIKVDVVSERPVFIQGLTDQTTVKDQVVTFTAVVRGTPRPHVRWFMAGEEVFNTDDRYQLVEGEDGRVELRISSLSSSDVGQSCECRACNDAGEAASLAYLVPGWCQRRPAVPVCSTAVRVVA